MLSNLRIENIAVARDLDIPFRDGFSVITGKTGAGKSILIDSLILLCGGRFSRELIRSGEERATVSAIFSCGEKEKQRLEAIGFPPDENGELQISRQIQSDGRSVAKINRKTAPVSALRDVTSVLMSIQDQDARGDYADKAGYSALLDSFADDGEEAERYGACYRRLTDLTGQIAELKKAMDQKELLLDVLRYQKKEIDAARLSDDGEEEKLRLLRTKLRSMEKVTKYSALVTSSLAYSEKGVTAAYMIERAENALSQISDAVDGAEEMMNRLSSFRYEIIDIADRVQSALEEEDLTDPVARLTQVETRLAQIEKLEKKYGANIREIREKRAEIAARITGIEEGDERLSELEKQRGEAEADAWDAALALRGKRKEAAERVTGEILESLRYLDMPKVRFRITVSPLPERDGGHDFRPDGCDDVDLMISVNAGEDMQSLGKVSSCGELSRITLAIRSALAGKNDVSVLIFDEIDTGVSGGTSERVGRKLKQLAEGAQVISITHSPQIASLADCHLLIEKTEENGRTESRVREIESEDRIAEIARIIGGISVTDKQMAAAREMLSNNQ